MKHKADHNKTFMFHGWGGFVLGFTSFPVLQNIENIGEHIINVFHLLTICSIEVYH